MIYSVILAAGLSSRMDTEKLLLPVGDRKLIEQTIISVWGIADGGTVMVIKPELEDKFMKPEGMQCLINPHPERGQSGSFALAVAWLKTFRPDCEGILVFLGDEPFADRKTAEKVLAEFRKNPEMIVMPKAGDRVGHPIAFGKKWFSAIQRLSGDEGGRQIIRRHPEMLRIVKTESVPVDIDTKEDYDLLKAGLEKQSDDLIIVRGAGDIATGTISRLMQAGFIVIALEIAEPTVIRRTVSFADAVRCGKAKVESITARRCVREEEMYEALQKGYLPVMVDPDGEFIEKLKPVAVIDAILAKKNLGTSRNMAPIVIALGPGFSAGEDCDAVVETKRGHYLGKVIYDGPAEANTGIPGNIGGYTHERVVHAPASGVISLVHDIGDHVEQNDVIAVIGAEGAETEVTAPLTGVLRGMIAEGTYVTKGLKIADVDPRDMREYCFSISDKARSVAGGSLEALMHLMNTRKER